MIILDTNVISELMRPQPDQRVLSWANSLDPEGAAITAMNEAEILHGLARLPDGRRAMQISSGPSRGFHCSPPTRICKGNWWPPLPIAPPRNRFTTWN